MTRFTPHGNGPHSFSERRLNDVGELHDPTIGCVVMLSVIGGRETSPSGSR